MMKKFYIISIALLSLFLKLQAQQTGTTLTVNSDSIDYAPYCNANGKVLLFQSNRSNGYKIYQAEYDSVANNWINAVPVNLSINEQFTLIGGPSLSADGKTLYFCTYRQKTKTEMDIWSSQLMDNGNWSEPVKFGSEINNSDSEGFPSISADGKRLFFTRQNGMDKNGIACSEIWVAEKREAEWINAKRVKISGGFDCVKAPRILNDNKTIIFASLNSNSKTGYDIYKGTFQDGDIENVTPVTLVNSADNEDFAAHFSDKEYLIVSSKGNLSSYKIPYRQWYIPEIYLSLHGIDKDLKYQVNAFVQLMDSSGVTLLKSDSCSIGSVFRYTLPAYKKYQLKLTANGYEDFTLVLDYTTEPQSKYVWIPAELKPRTKEVVLNITDAETNIGLDVEITITNLDMNEKIVINTSQGRDGKYAVNLREGNRYSVEVSSSEGYAYARTQINVPGGDMDTTMQASQMNGGLIPDVHMPVTPLKSGRKLELKDIYFDYNEYTLKEDSYEELLRVVELMNDNPKLVIEISAHTDDKGAADYNMKLSEKRAQEIVKYLVSKGVDIKRLRARGYGKTRPVAPNDTEENRAKNRRVELKVVDVK